MAEGIRLEVTIAGVDRIKAMLKKHQAAAVQALKKQLYLEAEGIMTQSKELVPVLTGALKDSGTVRLPREENGVIIQELGFGGVLLEQLSARRRSGSAFTPYAVFVHENTVVFHKVGMAKFLEIPFRQAERGLVDRVAAGMRRALEGI